jgi:hypothetical protein
MSRWIIALLIAILGFGLGVSYGWFIAPVEYVDTTPASLRPDYRTDFVLMAAERFHTDHDAEAAGRQLAILGSQSPAAHCGAAVSFAKVSAYGDKDRELLEELCRAMQAVSSAGAPVGTAP